MAKLNKCKLNVFWCVHKTQESSYTIRVNIQLKKMIVNVSEISEERIAFLFVFSANELF